MHMISRHGKDFWNMVKENAEVVKRKKEEHMQCYAEQQIARYRRNGVRLVTLPDVYGHRGRAR